MRRWATTALAAAAVGTASTAMAADLPVKAAVMPVVAAFNWTGFYVGGNIGYGWANGDTAFDPLPSAAAFINLAPTTLRPDPKGVVGGLQLGYNWQTGRFVLGVEADIQASRMSGTVTQTPIIQNNGTPFPGAGFLQASQKTNWFGTVRGRAGFLVQDTLLVFATGGLAYGHVDYTANTDFRPAGTTQYPASVGKTKTGWTVGGGVEWAFMQNWSAKFEYLHYRLGDETQTVNAVPLLPPFQVRYTWRTTADIVRAGLNWHFAPL